MEITSITCDFCHELITGEVIKPCKCDKYYHNTCIQHISNIAPDPLVIQKCDICYFKYKSTYKNKYDRYIYRYFNFISKKLYLNYTIFGLVGVITSLIINKNIDSIFYGMSISCLSYSCLIWSSILSSLYLYKLKDNWVPVVSSIFSILLIIINLHYSKNWFDWAILVIISALLVKTKKYLFILSSYYPYLIIINHYKSTSENLLI